MRLKVCSQGQRSPQISACGLGAWPRIPARRFLNKSAIGKRDGADSATSPCLAGRQPERPCARIARSSVVIQPCLIRRKRYTECRQLEGRPIAMGCARTAGGRVGAAVPPGSVVAWRFWTIVVVESAWLTERTLTCALLADELFAPIARLEPIQFPGANCKTDQPRRVGKPFLAAVRRT